MKRKHLIIGCGAAGLAAAQEIRSLSPEDEIVLITKEKHLPYSIAALPYLISGKMKESDLWLADEDYLSEMGYDLIRGKEVARVHPEEKRLTYKDGGSESYDRLLIASGSEPIKSDIRGLEEASPLVFHTLEDYHLLQQRLLNSKDVAIYGGGLVATALAVALLEAGYRVKIIVRSRVLRRYFDQDAGDIIEKILANSGADIYKGQVIDELRRTGERVEIALPDGTCLDADILVIALGVKPVTSLLAGTGIKLNDGVVVDSRMRTNIEDIYAAGDVAEAPEFFTGGLGLGLILPSAVSQGRAAGSNMAGKAITDEGWLSMNVFNLLGHRALSIGMAVGNDGQVLMEKDEERKQFKKLTFNGDRLVGAAFLNLDVDPGVF
ncbi:MAG: NADH-dependent phenylglyoxylate dehydrogenase subunit epsilon [Chloroflexi bacterium]|nr:NADH-dependent phenylglyoxylate dehydrogenase subunit epsilon [Chloroflexota bacterium]